MWHGETEANIHFPWVYILVTTVVLKHVHVSDWTSSVEYEFCPPKTYRQLMGRGASLVALLLQQ